MGNRRTVEELMEEINTLPLGERLVIQQQLNDRLIPQTSVAEQEPFYSNTLRISDEEADEMLRAINEPKYYTYIAKPQIHNPIAVAAVFAKELPVRYEPSHEDLDDIFGGFQSERTVEELVEEIYNMRTIGTQREILDR